MLTTLSFLTSPDGGGGGSDKLKALSAVEIIQYKEERKVTIKLKRISSKRTLQDEIIRV